MNLINTFPGLHTALLTCGFVEDFDSLDLTRWTKTTTDSGSILLQDEGLNGRVEFLPSDGTVADNDEAYLYTKEISKFLNGKPIFLLALLQFAEVATNAANILFGVGEGFGVANTLLDNGGGPPADYDGACWFKADGGTRWNFESSLGTTQQTTETDKTAGGSGFHTLGLLLNPLSATEIEAVPWIDTAGGNSLVQPYQYNANPRTPCIKHRFSYSSSGAMAICLGVKNGSAVQQPLVVDLIAFEQTR